MAERYGLVLTIQSDQELGSELIIEKGRVVDFPSIDTAVEAARKHSELPLLIKDWIYGVVPLYKDFRHGRPIESYTFFPRFERIVMH